MNHRNQQQAYALQSMTEWLAHPQELGKNPYSIEPAGEFDLYDLHYYIFKYKKSIFGKWLLGVCGGYEKDGLEHCGHVFSNMEPYDPSTAQEQAVSMVEMIRQYWMDQAKKAEEKPAEAGGNSRDGSERNSEDGSGSDLGAGSSGDSGDSSGDGSGDGSGDSSRSGTFVGFVLLSSPEWNPEKFKADLLADWGIECQEDAPDPSDPEDPPLVFSIGDAIGAVSLMPAPVPNNEAVDNASSNYMWPEAVEVVKTHQAHLVVALLGKNIPILEGGKLFVKLTAACCKQENVLGVNTSGTVFEPSYYLAAAQIMKEGEDELPVLNWIYFGIYRSEDGLNAYTFGLKSFGKEEIEVLHVHDEPNKLHSFLYDIVNYVLDQDVVLHDGETIGFSENQFLAIKRGAGVSLDETTLKIEYPQE
ncbi:DUF4261 domain-containing protein [Clostridium sp. MCC353]|uniref:DUF4261 domain-containing protein n=1 Tax=Clostridium sp. MCC353 TaxID=2592646 RepID=UPI001C00F9AF|nr:DUF4261 domain-containing protein [Clostridium sp. MCC353]MBT9776785.1 DUF4261 domain-containing protein [Clostridium sp. MCC353]